MKESVEDLKLGARATGALRNVDLDEARELLRRAQTALGGLGYQLGEHGDTAAGIHGIWDKSTQAAVLQFQTDRDLVRTGQLDSDTVAALFDEEDEAMDTEAAMTDDRDAGRREAAIMLQDDAHETMDDVLSEVHPTDADEDNLI